MKKLKYLFTILMTALLVGCANDVQVGSEENKNYFSYEASWEFEVTSTNLNSTSGVEQFTFNYKTIDQKKNVVICSALVEYPKNVTELDCVIIDCHGTIHNDSEAPSNHKHIDFTSNLKSTTGKNGLVIAPDYLGYGVSVDKVHPYMLTDLCARNIIDAVLSVLKNPNSFGNFKLKSNYRSFVLGYSQGGQTSLGTFRAVENYIPAEYKNLINLKKCYSGAGPHDLPATMDSFLNKGPTGDGFVFPNLIYLVIKGILSADYEWMQDYDYTDFFTNDFLNSNLKAGLDAKQVNTSSIAIQGELIKYQDLNYLISPALQDPTSKLYKDLKKALALNSLASGWTVKKEVYIYQHKNDDMVPSINITQVQNGIGKNNTLVTCDINEDSTLHTNIATLNFIHSQAAGQFYLNIYEDMKTQF